MAQNLKLGQRHFTGDTNRLGSFIPFISDISHGISDCQSVCRSSSSSNVTNNGNLHIYHNIQLAMVIDGLYSIYIVFNRMCIRWNFFVVCAVVLVVGSDIQ